MDRDLTKFRVIQVINSLAPAGAERLTVDLARTLDPEKFEVHIATVRDGALRVHVDEAGIPVHSTGYEFDYRWPLIVIEMVRYFRRVRPHVVHTHLLGSDIVGRIAAVLAGVPVIVSTQHNARPRQWWYHLYLVAAGRFTQATVACSSTVGDFCRIWMKVPPERLFEIDNGVDVEAYELSRGPQRSPVTFGALGSLIAVKGHVYLVDAFARIADELPGSRLIIAGEGAERFEIEQAIAERGLQDRIVLRGVVRDVPGHLRDVDVFVHSSLSEGLPMAILEAMAAAKPIVATDISVIPHVLADGVGVIVPPGDADALADAMLDLANDPQRAERMGEAAHERVREDYSLEHSVEQYGAMYKGLLQGSGLADSNGRPTAAVPREPMLWRLFRRALQTVLVVVVAYFVGDALWAGMSESGFGDVHFEPIPFIGSIAILFVYYAAFIGGLTLLFRAFGARTSYRDTFKISFLSSLGKYLPGGVWQVAGRVAMSPKIGVTRQTGLVVSIVESGLSVTGAVVAFLFATWLGAPLPAGMPHLPVGILAVLILVSLHPAIFGRALKLGMRLFGLRGEPPRIEFPATVGLALYYTFTWLLAGVAFRLFVLAVIEEPGLAWYAYVAYWAAGAVVGLLVLFAPGGIGAREAALLALMSGPVGAPAAAVIAVTARVWSTIVSLSLSLLATVMPFSMTSDEEEQ
ncbi:MAG: glycosyltransferase [Actinomycetota bacterium]|jgi:glycosyltransferase involved in cell wall biosynthesis|nr:glycosyltransferase [Actinomycetota bacterium]